MHQRDSLKLKAIRSNDLNVWLDFKKKCNTVNNEIKKGKKAYYLKEFCENTGNSKKTWKIINELTCRKHNNPQTKEISLNGSVVIPKPHTDYLTKSFSYTGAVLWNTLPTDLRQTENPNQFKAGCINFFYQ